MKAPHFWSAGLDPRSREAAPLTRLLLTPLAALYRRIAFPWGRMLKKPDDEQIRALGDLIMQDTPVRQAFGHFAHVSLDPEDSFGRVESTYQMMLSIEGEWQAFVKAQSKGMLDGDSIEAQLASAVQQGIIPADKAASIKEYNQRRYDALLTDAFEKSFFTAAQVKKDDEAA